jgi:hypothetical protein
MGWREDVKFGIGRISRLFLGDANGGLGTEVTATAEELNAVADVSGRTEELTVAGANAITAGVQSVELNNAVATIAATIADASNHQGLMVFKATSEPAGGQDHTVTLTAGTFDGTNNVATFADILDTLVVYFDSNGDGTIVENVGSVVLS